MNKPTREQENIINSDVCNMLVSAGAGCGKSTVLTARIIKRIKEGNLKLKNLIVLSFTNASANDIRKKISEALKKELDNNPNLIDEYEYVAQADISTFDSLCHNYFKKYSYKLNLKADINILDGTQFSFILSKIIDDVIEEYYDNPLLINLLDILTIRDDESFKEALFNFYTSYVNNVVDPILFLNQIVNITKDSNNKIINQYENSKNNIINEIKRMYFDSSISDEADVIFRSYINPILEANDCYDLENFKLDIKGLPGRNRKPFNKGYEKEFHGEFKPLLEKYLEYNDSILDIKNSLDESLKYSLLIKSICIDIINKYNEVSKEKNAFTFNDVAKMVIKIFKENDDVLKEVKNNIKEIYVDEYQDTSNIQEELINLISNNNLIVVGDVKQSIYRFRDANPDIFKSKFKLFGENIGGKRIDLKDNFRSRPKLLEEINDIFDLLMTNDFDGIDYKLEHRLKPGNKILTSREKGIEFYHVNTKNEDGKARIKSEVAIETFKRVLKDIKNKMDNNNELEFKDFSIIVRNKNYFNEYSKIAEEYGIPLACEASKPFIRNTEIMAFNSILNYIRTQDKIYMVSILRSFLFDISDEDIFNLVTNDLSIKEFDDKINQIVVSKDYITLYDLVSLIYDVFDFYHNIYKLDDPIGAEKRLLYLLNSTDTYMNLGWSYIDFSEYMNLLNAPSIRKELDIAYDSGDEFSENAINLMTIHKSKGLEFPYVYFIETDSKVGKISSNSIVFNKNVGLAIRPLFKKPYIFNLVNEENRLEQIYEDLRLLYVCLTRAKMGIIIFTGSDNYSDKTVLNLSVNKDIKKEYKTFDDMLMSAFESYEAKEDIDISLEFNKNEIIKKEISFDSISYDLNLYNKNVASHGVSELIDKHKALLLEHGTKMHEIFEYTDFLNPNYDQLDSKTKSKIELFILKLNKIVNDKIIHYYKEYEFKYNDTTSIIDLMVETNNKLIIIDYKNNDIYKDYYDKQVKTYMNEIKKRSDKNIEGYLYSIESGDYRKVE